MKILVSCDNCGIQFLKDEFFIKLYKHNYCSLNCAWKSKSRMGHLKNRVSLTCLYCNNIFEVPKHKELTAKFCSRKCKINFQKGKLPLWTNNKEKRSLTYFINTLNKYQNLGWNVKMHSETLRKMLKHYNIDVSKCSVCGSPRFIVIHHKNENQSDNRLENLQVLCTSCHLHHHKGGKNN
jgi:hypothetical protein